MFFGQFGHIKLNPHKATNGLSTLAIKKKSVTNSSDLGKHKQHYHKPYIYFVSCCYSLKWTFSLSVRLVYATL